MPDPLLIQEQIDIACSLAEGQFREFKSGYAGPPAEKVKREVKLICRDIAEGLVAFANADGGELIIGVEDDGTITGIDKFTPEEIEILKSAPKTHVHKNTPLQSVLVYHTRVHEKSVLYFRIAKGTKQIHLTSDGRCLRRNDLETIPVPAEEIQFERRETISREYDRDFIDGASVADLDRSLLQVISSQISTGISIEKCLQYLGLAEYDSQTGLRIRRAALLLFGNKIDDWHPRVQVRIMKVNGTEVGAGPKYNISGDDTIRRNIFLLIDEAWEKLRPYLVVTKFQDDARFKTTYIYPEIACREALINAVAHRDYSEEGRGIEIFIFDDRIEIKKIREGFCHPYLFPILKN